MMLTALSSPASARDSYSFTVHGHHIYISRNCRSLSCVSVSGVGNWRHGRRDDDADDVASVKDPAPVSAPAAQPAPPAPSVAPPQTQPISGPTIVQVPPAPASAEPVRPAMRAQTIAPPVQLPPAPVQPAPPPVQVKPAPPTSPTLAAMPSAAKPSAAMPSAQIVPPPALSGTGFEVVKPQASSAADASGAKMPDKPQDKPREKPVVEQPAPRVASVSPPDESDAETPIGDWETEGKSGLVRIEACGPSLCGYVLNASTRAKGETVLVNMRPKKNKQWTGSVYSRSSGNGYYGTITLKDGDTLRVEACALGSYFCSGNNWTRFEQSRSVRPDPVVSSR
jgi:hypothetical protein